MHGVAESVRPWWVPQHDGVGSGQRGRQGPWKGHQGHPLFLPQDQLLRNVALGGKWREQSPLRVHDAVLRYA